MLKRILGIGFILLIASISFAQDTATFVSSYEGNLTFDYPVELVASDYDAEFLIVVSREDVNPSSTLEEGQAALHHSLEFLGPARGCKSTL